jgi:Uma2 family endonuclease
MMNDALQTGTVTFEEFCRRIPDGQKADLIDGGIHMASPDNTDADNLCLWLGSLLYVFVQVQALGRVCGSRVAFCLSERHAPEPDISFVQASRVHLIHPGYVDGPPDLAIEIVSPDSVERDYVAKRELYRQAGVAEYWIVDEIEKRVSLLRLDSRGRYREVKERQGELHSQVVPGFWIRPAWLWQDPLPVRQEVYQEIMAHLR